MCLVVEILDRTVVVDTDVSDSLVILFYGIRIERIISREVCDSYIIYAISMSCVFYVVFKILGFLVDFVRAYYEGLNESAGSYAQCEYKYHDYRHLEQLCDLTLLDMNRKSHRSYNAEHHDDAVYPKGYVDVYETCSVDCTCVNMQKIELLQEEVNRKHQVENNAEDDELAACNVHQILNIIIIDVSSMTSFLLSVRVESRFHSLFTRSSHPADHGVVYRCTVDDLRFRVLFLFFELRLRRKIIVFMPEDVRSSDGKQEHIIDYCDYY